MTASEHSHPRSSPIDERFSDPPGGYPDMGTRTLDGVRLLRAPAVPTAVVRAAGVSMTRLPELFDTVFGSVFPAAFAAGLAPTGPAFALYTSTVDSTEASADLEVGFPLSRPLREQTSDEPIEAGGHRVVASTLPAAHVAVISHVGPYDQLAAAWGEFMDSIEGHGLTPGSPFWEAYVTEPTPETDPQALRTDLFCVVEPPDGTA